MQNSHQSDGLHRDSLSADSCRLDDIATTKIIDAPERVECPRKADTQTASLNGVAAKERDRRRSTRRQFDAVVRVYGRTLNGSPFYEDARTINVSMHGALLVLNVTVSKGQKLLLFNEAAQRQQMCQIVDIRVRDMESREVAVAFPTPHAEFWHVFPTAHRMRLHPR
jgi:hypothetical protein